MPVRAAAAHEHKASRTIAPSATGLPRFMVHRLGVVSGVPLTPVIYRSSGAMLQGALLSAALALLAAALLH